MQRSQIAAALPYCLADLHQAACSAQAAAQSPLLAAQEALLGPRLPRQLLAAQEQAAPQLQLVMLLATRWAQPGAQPPPEALRGGCLLQHCLQLPAACLDGPLSI